MTKRCISTMSHNSMRHGYVKSQSGSALIIAIFVVIVISLLGPSLVSLQRDNAESTSYEIYAARAYLSAYSASEVALTQLFPLSSSADCASVSDEPTLSASNGFHGCSVKVECDDELDSVEGKRRYQVVSTAVCETTGITTRRQITVEARGL